MRKLSVIALLLALVMIFAGCNLIQVNEERDMQRVVMKVGDESVLKKDYVDTFVSTLYQYNVTKEQLSDSEVFEQLQEMVLTKLETNKILDIKAKEMGCYDFTQEELDEIDSTVEETFSYYRGIAKSTILAKEENKDKTEEELEDQIEEEYQKMIGNMKVDKEAYTEQVKGQKAALKLYDKITQIEPITESELQSEYNRKIGEQRIGFQEGTLNFESIYVNGDTIYYNPAGMRKARHILIAIPEDMRSKISNLKQNGDTEEADKIMKEELAKIEGKANDVYKQLEEGKDFNELVKEFGEDPGMKEDNFYVMKENSTSFDPKFVEGLFSIKKKGEYTKPVASDFGYHIILYADDLQEGDVPFEDVKAILEDELTTTKKEAMYADQLAAWKEEMKIKVYKSNLKYSFN